MTRVRAAVYRYVVWLHCLVGIAVLPLLWLYAPKIALPWLPPTAPSPAANSPDRQVPPSPAPSVPATAQDTPAQSEFGGWPEPELLVTDRLSVLTLLAAAWLIGSTVMLTRLTVAWIRLYRLCRSAEPVPDAATVVESPRKAARILTSRETATPLCLGVLHPIIVLPRQVFDHCDENQLRMVLVHEFAHLERRDYVTNLFQRLLESALFFHPLVWFASRQLTHERERICDNRVLESGAAPADYAQLLSRLAEGVVGAPAFRGVALLEGRLLARVRTVLQSPAQHPTRLSLAAVITCTTATTVACGAIGTLRLTEALPVAAQEEPTQRAPLSEQTAHDDQLTEPWSGTVTVQERAVLPVRHTGEINEFVFSPNGEMSATASYDGTVKLWDVATRQERATLEPNLGRCHAVAFSPDGKTLATGSGNWNEEVGGVKLWDAITGQERLTLEQDVIPVLSLAFSPDGTLLAAGSGRSPYSGPREGWVTLWDVPSGQKRAVLGGYDRIVPSVAFSPDGKMLATGTLRAVKVWDVMTEKLLITLNAFNNWVYGVAFSPDGATLATPSGVSGVESTVKLWEVPTWKEDATWSVPWMVFDVAFSPDGRILAAAGGVAKQTPDHQVEPLGEVRFWDVAAKEERFRFRPHGSWISTVAFAPDGKTLATIRGPVVKLWDVITEP